MKMMDENEYKKVVLGVMCKIDEICREHNLQYMIFYGSLLGAVRHKGFIPWDDDIDIVMKREDCYKLSEIINSGDYGLNYISIETNPDTIFPCGKVCDTNTTIEESGFVSVDGYGAFVDIFPLDYLSDDPKERAKIKKKCLFLRKMIVHSARLSYTKSDSLVTNIKRSLAFNVGKLCNTKKLVERFTALATQYNETNRTYIGVVHDNEYRVEELMNTSEVEFEGHYFLGPENPDEILTGLYGDYMKLPPVEQQISNHTIKAYYK